MEQPLPRIKVRRYPGRAHYTSEVIRSIIDEAYFCHVSFIRNGYPVLIPMIHARIDNGLYLHGAKSSGLFKDFTPKVTVSVAFTILDALVMARSVHNHSAHYRSVVLYGTPQEVFDSDKKRAALKALVDRLAPGRWDDARQPNDKELRMTRMFAIAIDRASAKVHTDAPFEEPSDLGRPTWAGVLPLRLTFGLPQPSPSQAPDLPLPPYLRAFIEGAAPR